MSKYNNELHKHKAVDAIKWIVVFVLILAIIGAVVCLALQVSGEFDFFKDKDNPADESPIEGDNGEQDPAEQEAEHFLAEGNANMQIRMLSLEEFEDYGISTIAESAYQLTATIEPATADNLNVTWKAAFQNPSSAWAMGKTVTEYIKIGTPSAAGNKSIVNVECLKPFSEVIEITVQSQDNLGAMASCTCNYIKRITGVNVSVQAEKVAFNTDYIVTENFTYSDGTITGELAVTSYKVQLADGIKSALNAVTGQYNYNPTQAYVSYNGSDPIFKLMSANIQPIAGIGKSVATAGYACHEDVPITSNAGEHKFAFSGETPAEVFGTVIDVTLPVPCTDTTYENQVRSRVISACKTNVNNTFKSKLSEIQDKHAVLSLVFTYTYKGKSYVQGSVVNADLLFDADSFVVHVTGVTLDKADLEY